MRVKSFRDLLVWQRAVELVGACAELTPQLKGPGAPELKVQLRRAAMSVPSNIAEGHSRPNRAEFLHFLGIARGSLREAENHLLIARQLELGPPDQLERCLALADECSRMLFVMRKRLG